MKIRASLASKLVLTKETVVALRCKTSIRTGPEYLEPFSGTHEYCTVSNQIRKP